MLKIVTIKLIAPKIELVPERWKLKIARSTEGPECACKADNGGYTVHPVPAPVSTKADKSNKANDGGSNQKLIYLQIQCKNVQIKLLTSESKRKIVKICLI